MHAPLDATDASPDATDGDITQYWTAADCAEALNEQCEALLYFANDDSEFARLNPDSYKEEYAEAHVEHLADCARHSFLYASLGLIDANTVAEKLEQFAVDGGMDRGKAKSILAHARNGARLVRKRDLEEKYAEDEFAANDLDSAIDRANERFAFIVLGGQTAIMENYFAEELKIPRPAIRFIKKTAFLDMVATQRIAFMNAEGKIEYKPLGPLWFTHPDRRSYSRVVFRPKQTVPSDVYNLWMGFVVEAKEGDCSKILAHIRDIICSGNKDDYLWVLAWCADLIQHPERKNGTSLVLTGKQGCGKTFLGKLLGSFMPDHHFLADNTEHVTGKFNAHLVRTVLLQCEEAFWAGNKQAEGKIKHLITDDKQGLELKGKDVEQVDSYVHLMLTSNNPWAIAVAMDDRRTASFECDNKYAYVNNHPDREKYFKELFHEIDNGGREAFFHLLSNYKYDVATLRKIPETKGRTQQKTESMQPEEKWWHGILRAGVLPGDWNGYKCTSMTFLHQDLEAFCHSIGNRHVITPNALGIKLKEWMRREENMVVIDSRGTLWNVERRATVAWRRKYQFASLDDCRNAFTLCCPGLEWDGCREEWDMDHRWTLEAPRTTDNDVPM